jgi:hypothetical protein
MFGALLTLHGNTPRSWLGARSGVEEFPDQLFFLSGHRGRGIPHVICAGASRALAKQILGYGVASQTRKIKSSSLHDQQQIKLRSEPNKS